MKRAREEERGAGAGSAPSSQGGIPASPSLTLSDEQRAALAAFQAGHNVFVTGSGGVGKSVLMRSIKEAAIEAHGEACVLVCASTGVAAVPLDGVTLHSATGVGVPLAYRDFSKVFSPKAKARLRQCKVLLIDEVSMVSGEFLDALDDAVSRVRSEQADEQRKKKERSVEIRPPDADPAFGGIQVVCMGDFFQLPPVVTKQFGGLAALTGPHFSLLAASPDTSKDPLIAGVWERHPFYRAACGAPPACPRATSCCRAPSSPWTRR